MLNPYLLEELCEVQASLEDLSDDELVEHRDVIKKRVDYVIEQVAIDNNLWNSFL